jgi:hypothetical protein
VFLAERAKLYNRFTHEFMQRFCTEAGAIDWPRLVEYNCTLAKYPR